MKDNIIEEVTAGEYKYGFVTDVETETIPKGLNEEVIRTISAKKEEPEIGRASCRERVSF